MNVVEKTECALSKYSCNIASIVVQDHCYVYINIHTHTYVQPSVWLSLFAFFSNSNCSKPHFALDAKEITSNKNKNYINICTRDVESDARILLNVCQFLCFTAAFYFYTGEGNFREIRTCKRL